MASHSAYVALGANQKEPVEQLIKARKELSGLPKSRLISCSSLYRTEPVGYSEQPDFINAVCRLETRLSPDELLEALQEIENNHGRIRGAEKNGPRPLDLDILLYSNWVRSGKNLVIPHPRMLERSFVLIPLSEIAPDEMRLPDGSRIGKYLKQCVNHRVEKTPATWNVEDRK